MSSKITAMALRARLTPTTTRAGQRFLLAPHPTRPYSSADDLPTPPPLLQKLKGDLKTAMRAKDANRLSVLRAVMAGNLNASKTAAPIRTDLQLVALMRRLAKGAEDAAAEARAAGRADLADKEVAQGAILAEYMQGSGVSLPGEEELRKAVEEAVVEVRAAGTDRKLVFKELMKKMIVKLEGRDVDMKTLSDMVKKAAASS